MGVLFALQAHGAEEAAPGFASPFEVNFGLFFWTWVVFIVLFLVLKRFAWPAILKATEEREQTLARARQEQQQVLDRAKKEIAAEKDRAVAELRREAVDLSLAAASKLLREKIDGEADRRLVERYLTDLEERH